MYAIIQSLVVSTSAETGEAIDVDHLKQEVGSEVVINDVLLIGDGDSTVIGTPTVEGAVVKATIEEQFRDRKIIVLKWHVSTVYRPKRGHRQQLTRLRINDITV